MPDDAENLLRKRQEQLTRFRDEGKRRCPGLDGFGDEVAKPLPVPPKIEAIADGSLKQKAKETWEAASRLFVLIHRWSLWLDRLTYCGKEVEFSLNLVNRMRFATGQNISTLCWHGLSSPVFSPETEHLLTDKFPGMPPPESYPAWWDDADYVWGSFDRFWNPSFPRIHGEVVDDLYLLKETLKDAPSTAFRPDMGANSDRSPGPHEARRKLTQNHERDTFMFELYKNTKKTLKAIRKDVKDKGGWYALYTDSAALKAIQRFAAATGQDVPTRNARNKN